jgi:O-antigen ligase
MTQISNTISKNLNTSKTFNLAKLDIINKWIAIILAFMIPISTAGTNITALVILILFLASGQWKKKYSLLKNNPLFLLALALYLALAIGILYSKSDSIHHDIMRLMKYNKLLLIPIIIYLFQDIKYKKIGIYAFLSGVALSIVIGYLHFFFNTPLPSGSTNTPGNIFIHHIITTAFMAFFTTFCLYKVICSKAIKLRVTWLIFAFSSIYYIYFISGVRTGYLIQSTLLLFFVFYFLKNKTISAKKCFLNILLIVFLSTIVASIGLKDSSLQNRINDVIHDITLFKKHNSNTSIGSRLSWYINDAKLIAKKPIFGYGTGSLTDVYAAKFSGKNLPLTTNPHNQYIEIAFQLGIFGLSIYLALLFFAYKNICKDSLINIMGKSAIILIVFGSFFNSWLLDLAPGFFLCYFAALANKPKTIK